MPIVADTHVHLYPHYDIALALTALADNLSKRQEEAGLGSAPDVTRAACLTERADCHLFRDLAAGRVSLPGRIRVTPTTDAEALQVDVGGAPFFLLAGRQIVTAERIEILALGTDSEFADGQPATRALDAALAAGAVCVLPWAPGKWWFARGRLVRELLDTRTGDLCVGDTTLRPTIWPTPVLMRHARRRGIGLLAGSDPLPVAGEEPVAGRLASLLTGNLDASAPARSLRAALRESGPATARLGSRDSVLNVGRRLRANAASRS